MALMLLITFYSGNIMSIEVVVTPLGSCSVCRGPSDNGAPNDPEWCGFGRGS